MNEIEALKAELAQTKLAYETAAQMLQFQTGFLARTAHELRSPLSSIMSLNQLIISDLCDSPEEEREFVQQAYNSAIKLLKLLDEVINVAKTEYGNNPLEIKSVTIASLLEEVRSLTHLQAQNYGIHLVLDAIAPDLRVLADSARLRQALVILIDTVISNIDGGTIACGARLNQQSNLVEITIDTPCAIAVWSESVNFLEQIPEFTPENVTKFSQNLEFSPGMKLSLAQKLISSMQGKLQLAELTIDATGKTVTQIQCQFPLTQP